MTRRSGGVTYLSLFLLASRTSAKTDSDTSGNITNTIAPNVFVEGGINSDILSTHGLLGELTNSFNSIAGTSLESTIHTQRIRHVGATRDRWDEERERGPIKSGNSKLHTPCGCSCEY